MVQTNERPEAKHFAVETLESLQKLCPMSMAVTLRHFAAVYHAVRRGAPAAALKDTVLQAERNYNPVGRFPLLLSGQGLYLPLCSSDHHEAHEQARI